MTIFFFFGRTCRHNMHFNQVEKALITDQLVPIHTRAVSASSIATFVVLQARTLLSMALYIYCVC